MNRKNHEGFSVIGLTARVRNDEPSGIGALWERFYQTDLRARIPEAISADIYCVYHAYDGGHADPYAMTVGFRVSPDAICPGGLSHISVPTQTMARFEAIGPQPETLIAQWQAIWQSDLDRAFVADFDVYDSEKPHRVTVNVGVKSS